MKDDQLSRAADQSAFAKDADEPLGGQPRRSVGSRMALLIAGFALLFVVGVVAGAQRNAPGSSPTVTATAPGMQGTIYELPGTEETNFGPATREQKATDEASATYSLIVPEMGSDIRSGWMQVGMDVEPGTYVGEPSVRGALCHWQRIGAGNHGLMVIINEVVTNARVNVTIQSDDAVFFSHGCTWTKRLGR